MYPENLEVRIGNVLRFEYPDTNRLGVDAHWEERAIVVTGVRDLVAHPLHLITPETEPFVRRGRWLVTGMDLDKDEYRSFYLEAMRDTRRDTWLTLGLYDPLQPEAGPWRTRGVFAPTERDATFLRKVIRYYREIAEEQPSVLDSLAVFPLTEEVA